MARSLEIQEHLPTQRQATGDSVTVALQGEFAGAFHARTISPRPDRVATTDDATVYRFVAVPGQPHRIRFDGQMESIGAVDGTVRVDDGGALAIHTFVYP